MRAVPLTSINIYEFDADEKLIDKVLIEIKSTDFIWRTSDGHQSLKVGYLDIDKNVSYYNDTLFEWMKSCMNEVSKIHYSNLNFEICDSWITKSALGEGAQAHVHDWSVLSGVLYLTDSKTGNTVFHYIDVMSSQTAKSFTDGSQMSTYASSAKKGKLIIFPSFLEHSVSMVKDINVPRYSLIFNAYPSGIISDRRTGLLDIKVSTVKERYLNFLKDKNERNN